MMKFILFLNLFFFTSCSWFISKLDQDSFFIPSNEKDLAFIFSGNINGETHPCGCRHFPLGGIPQVAGFHKKLIQSKNIFYVDAGDTFFDSAVLPLQVRESSKYNAQQLAKILSDLGLKLTVPGDQDLALGIDEYFNLFKETQISVLLSNLKTAKYSHKKWYLIKTGMQSIYFLGVTDPDVLMNYQELFYPVEKGIKDGLQIIKKNGYDEKNPFHRLIVISHSGIKKDSSLAKTFPQIDWILGAHTQSFTTFPYEEGKTRIVQVLSRNHHIGEVSISSSKDKNSDTFKSHEIREELKDFLSLDDPIQLFLPTHKAKLNEIRMKEQGLSLQPVHTKRKENIPTSISCLKCHENQAKHWQQTPHSLAFITLAKNKEEFNSKCIGCHSLGFEKVDGFQQTKEIVQLEPHDDILVEEYLKEVNLAITSKLEGPIRDQSPLKLIELNKIWKNIDENYNINFKYANVQCLNCHEITADHMKDLQAKSSKKVTRDKCLSCHNPDQSPEWYSNGSLNTEYVDKMMKRVSCPQTK